MPTPGIGELMLIFGVVVLLFGGKKLPELGKSLGESVKNFRSGIRDNEAPKSLTSENDDGKQ